MSSRLGVDLGATWLRACLARDGRQAWSSRAPATNWRGLDVALRKILRAKGVKRVDALTVGGTRLGGGKDRLALRRRLSALAARVEVRPDFEIAHLAAFGDQPGILLVASTGSIAYARDASGRARREGGLGFIFGDEGSGFWLGSQAVRDERLRRRLRLPSPLDLTHRPDPVRAVAALAPRVLAKSPRLRGKAAAHLAALARAAKKKSNFPRPVPLALHGSLFRNARFKAAVLRRLGRGWRLVFPRLSAEKAAAGL